MKTRVALVLSIICMSACTTGGGVDAGTDASTPDAPVEPSPSVTLPEGEVLGYRTTGVVNYLGIPYAEAPEGPLRFAPPVARAPWSEPIGPVRSPPICPQSAVGLAGGREDCLVVNVHVPDDAPPNAPVMVWIHGGAFLVGSGIGLDRTTLGDFLAREQHAIVVSVNYRLGPFGFFSYPGIATGNQGIRDQQLALHWVHDHIAAFGGDPEQVTLVGESAGGLSVCMHLISPASRGLFVRAISESGLCDGHLPSAAEALESGTALVEAVGCSDASDVGACIRAVSVADLFAAAGPAADLTVLLSGTSNRPFWASIDGEVIPGSFREVVSAAEHNSVPTLMGWNRDEGTLFVGLAENAGTPADMAAYDSAITSFATRQGVDEAVLRAAYPISDHPDIGAAIADLVGDAELICPSRRAAVLLSEAGTEVHVYRFDFDEALFQLTLPRALGAFHSAEIQFVFGHPVGMSRFPDTQIPLYMAMQGAWGAFVRGEAPMPGIPWPAFAVPSEDAVIFDQPLSAVTMPNQDECALWE